MKKAYLALPIALFASVNLIHAAVFVTPVAIDPNLVNGSGGGNYGGNLDKITDFSGMSDNGQPLSPSAWEATSNSYPDEWQSDGTGNGLLDGSGPNNPAGSNGKIGWLTFDLGASKDLKDLYFWNVRSLTNAQTRGFNIYFSDTALNQPAIPGQNSSAFDYDFSVANGWTQFDDNDADPTTARFTMAATTGAPSLAQDIIDVDGVTAQYVGIEIITNNGSTTRVGLAEFAVTEQIQGVVPEPGTVSMLALGMLLLRSRKHYRNSKSLRAGQATA